MPLDPKLQAICDLYTSTTAGTGSSGPVYFYVGYKMEGVRLNTKVVFPRAMPGMASIVGRVRAVVEGEAQRRMLSKKVDSVKAFDEVTRSWVSLDACELSPGAQLYAFEAGENMHVGHIPAHVDRQEALSPKQTVEKYITPPREKPCTLRIASDLGGRRVNYLHTFPAVPSIEEVKTAARGLLEQEAALRVNVEVRMTQIQVQGTDSKWRPLSIATQLRNNSQLYVMQGERRPPLILPPAVEPLCTPPRTSVSHTPKLLGHSPLLGNVVSPLRLSYDDAPVSTQPPSCDERSSCVSHDTVPSAPVK